MAGVTRIKALLLVAGLTLLAGCGQEGASGVVCTTIAEAGLSVRVSDARTGSAVCDATVTATEAGYSETLLPLDCRYLGAYERPGTYVVSVTAAGFVPKAVTGVRVSMGTGRCPHVREVALDVALERGP